MAEPSDPKSARDFDWARARERLQRAQDAIDDALHPSSALIERVLQDRAEKLALRPAAAAATIPFEVVAFSLGNERYAVDAGYVGRAIALPRLTSVPGIAACYLGIFIQRGSVYPLIDIRALRAIASLAAATPAFALLIDDGVRHIALAADTIEGFIALDAASIAPAAAAQRREADFVHGFAPDSILVLDPQRLLQDLRLQVNDQPSPRSHANTEDEST